TARSFSSPTTRPTTSTTATRSSASAAPSTSCTKSPRSRRSATGRRTRRSSSRSASRGSDGAEKGCLLPFPFAAGEYHSSMRSAPLLLVGLSVPCWVFGFVFSGCGSEVQTQPPGQGGGGGALHSGPGGGFAGSTGAIIFDAGHDAFDEYHDPGCPDA